MWRLLDLERVSHKISPTRVSNLHMREKKQNVLAVKFIGQYFFVILDSIDFCSVFLCFIIRGDSSSVSCKA